MGLLAARIVCRGQDCRIALRYPEGPVLSGISYAAQQVPRV